MYYEYLDIFINLDSNNFIESQPIILALTKQKGYIVNVYNKLFL